MKVRAFIFAYAILTVPGSLKAVKPVCLKDLSALGKLPIRYGSNFAKRVLAGFEGAELVGKDNQVYQIKAGVKGDRLTLTIKDKAGADVAYFERSFLKGGRLIEFYDARIAPKHRGNGIATAVTAHLLKLVPAGTRVEFDSTNAESRAYLTAMVEKIERNPEIKQLMLSDPDHARKLIHEKLNRRLNYKLRNDPDGLPPQLLMLYNAGWKRIRVRQSLTNETIFTYRAKKED